MSTISHSTLSLLLTVREQPHLVNWFINHYDDLLKNCEVIVIDSEGGETLKQYASYYTKAEMQLDKARKLAIQKTETSFASIIDIDTLLPQGYIKSALKILQQNKADAVAIDYKPPQGHLAFGTSLWKTLTLQQLYDWQMGSRFCECIHMWRRIHQNKFKLATLPLYARHKKNELLH